MIALLTAGVMTVAAIATSPVVIATTFTLKIIGIKNSLHSPKATVSPISAGEIAAHKRAGVQ